MHTPYQEMKEVVKASVQADEVPALFVVMQNCAPRWLRKQGFPGKQGSRVSKDSRALRRGPQVQSGTCSFIENL